MDQAELLRHAARALESLDIPGMLVGSYASSIHGEPRYTQDIDIVLDLDASKIGDFCAAFPPDELYLSEAAVRDAVRRRFQFNVLCPASGDKIDFILPHASAWGRSQLTRRRRVEIGPEFHFNVASPADVIVGKLVYFADGGSEKHLRDIAGILKVSQQLVDRAEVARWATELGVVETWNRVVAAVDAPRS